MIIRYHKRFEKSFKSLSDVDKRRVIKAIEKFIGDPFHPSLRNHGLLGNLRGLRAIAASPDIRLVFEEFDGYVAVLFLDLGSHDRVYR